VEGQNCKSNAKIDCSKITKTYDTIDNIYCFPEDESAFNAKERMGFKMVKKNFFETGIGSMIMDMYKSSRAIYWSLAMSIVYSMAFIYLMSYFAETLAWICVFLVQVGLVFGCAAAFYFRQLEQDEYKSFMNDPNNT